MVGSVGVDGFVVVVSAGGFVTGSVGVVAVSVGVSGFVTGPVGLVDGSVVGFVAGSVVGLVVESVGVEGSVGVTCSGTVVDVGEELEESSPQPAIITVINAAQIIGKALPAINFFIFIVFPLVYYLFP
jgi:hypothetical protein